MEIEDEIKHDWYYSAVVLRIFKDEVKLMYHIRQLEDGPYYLRVKADIINHLKKRILPKIHTA